MIKKIILILFMGAFLCSNAQDYNTEKTLDTVAVVFKAKLFTISQHGYQSKQKLIESLESLPYEVYGKHDFIIIKIKGSSYCYEKGHLFTFTWCDCDYYIAYSIKKDIFYLLGGFKTDDIREFSKEYLKSMFYFDWSYQASDAVLNNFLKYIASKKIKKARKCFNQCIETWDVLSD